METDLVYIDSSIFIEKNFFFAGTSLGALAKWAKSKKIQIILTDITINEARSNIKKNVEKAVQSIRKFRNQAMILRNLKQDSITSIFSDLDNQGYEKEINSQFDDFISECLVEIISINEVDIDNIFNLYFDKKPPFGSGKKRNEFPDAFIMAGLNDWAEQEGKPIYIVSKDKDMEEGVSSFKHLHYVDSLESYLDIVALHYEVLGPLSTRLLKENINKIKELIEERFSYFGFYLEDQDGDVLDVEVIDVEDPEEYLISVESGYAKFELTTEVHYEAEIEYDDLETATYDSEDKVLIPWRKIEKTVNHSEIIQADIQFSFSESEPHDFDVSDLQIRIPTDVGVKSEENGWPYK